MKRWISRIFSGLPGAGLILQYLCCSIRVQRAATLQKRQYEFDLLDVGYFTRQGRRACFVNSRATLSNRPWLGL